MNSKSTQNDSSSTEPKEGIHNQKKKEQDGVRNSRKKATAPGVGGKKESAKGSDQAKGEDGQRARREHKPKIQAVKPKEEMEKTNVETEKTNVEMEKQIVEMAEPNVEGAKPKVETAKSKESPKMKDEAQIPVGYNHDATESIENLCKEFDLHDLNSGLTTEQVKINREKYGENYIEKDDATPVWLIFLSQYYSPVVVLLLVAALASLVLNEIVEGVAIISIVTLNACLATYMEKSSGDAIAKLAEMASPQCTVLRNGNKIVIPSREVVVGDVVIISTGDSISADLRLTEVIELKTNESLLTGESEDIKKTLTPDDCTTPFATNLCFATTSVTNGSGKGIVTATGLNTQVGKIASQLKRSSKGSKLTPLQVALNKLGGLIGLIAIIVLVFIISLAVLINYRDPAHADKDPILVIIIIGVGFAVSSVPEGLPMVVTITLSAGAKDMVRKNANVRKLPAVETLGCCSVICSDKTGTLTEGKMTAINAVTFAKNSSLSDKNNNLTKTFDFYPTKGFEPYGGLFDSGKLTNELKKKIVIAKNQNISYDSILYDYGNPKNDSIDVKKTRSLMFAAYLNSYDTTLARDPKTSKWTIHGNMSEGPIVVAAAKVGYSFITDDSHHSDVKEYTRLDDLEVTFNSSRKMKITFYKLKKENMFEYIHLERTGKVFTHVALIKGAPDKLLDRSTHLLEESPKGPQICWSAKISENEKDVLAQKNLELSQKALRVLAVCIKPLTSEHISLLKSLDDADERLKFVTTDEDSGFIPLGYVAAFDPPRPGVKEAIQTCRDAQVKVIMITGDQKPTAIAIGKLIGLIGEDKAGQADQADGHGDRANEADAQAIECSELHINKNPNEPVLPDDQLDAFTDKILIYSRAQPEDKITIVQSLKRKGYLVAMTGDGVNDAPALKAADIGVAMGINGTEVAKGASEMILIDDNFCTVVSAIDVGRTIFSNIQKFVCFLLGTNIGEILYLSIAIAAQMPFPLEALQILFLNLMTDGCPAVALSREPPNHDNMKTPPRPKKQPIMTKKWWFYGIIPHTVFEALCVLVSLAFSLYICTGSYTLNDIHSSCRTVSFPNVSDESIKHEYKYFCSTYEYRVSPDYVGWITNVNFWHPKKNKTVTFWGAAKGKVKNITPTSIEVHPEIRTIMEDGCPGDLETDEYGWCRPKSNIYVSGKDHELPHGVFRKNFEDVASKGSKRGRTMAFISAVWCEMLRAYTVRSWEPFYKVFNRNMWMHLACSISATLTFLSTCIPGITSVLNTTCLLWWQYLLGISWALLNMLLDEIVPKVIYRRRYMSVKK
ncbi:P-type ATPase, putative [Plasmodium knowlesi strain H]|uniref:P-type sodium-transporting ATPase4 n=3 Tax=Plasmodium knowlesi TaxID=5850 RepID=A0A5K1VJW7_PLAKH|nr:non-SERCA-type Ca2+ -transporting P-ATPase, putative [Plasmodium knowlesi strain H]OTN66662.1 putative p-type ATPase [Plasmodium knowlesi]CAA9990158.1 non-SERCA-type Ca2+ -transporting P-ATPase, putative [Plasmodium knowlesi strain H]SBO25850.1 P-type ATPase, putative [Plasmodium knowlesi strain H]SBO28631.1 P-type ATPase, putative [Plasmodium knowlesi strain H]VVS79632.1 non-SERCA-type Ca2+ -transporting P-ATPase, putative [Plasmodium knowlesi strain H]|eukprot:XP_002260625.1 P-type ATPase, putative [Plasmodium knowlesi strain H]